MADPNKPPAAPRYDFTGARPRVRTVRLHRSGNSLGLYVPHVVAAKLGLQKGDECRMYIVGRVLCLQPATQDSWTPGVVCVTPSQLRREGE